MRIKAERSFRRISGQFLAALVAGALMQASHGDELSERQAIVDQVNQLWQTRDYAKLDQLQQNLLKSGKRTESGIWLLAPFNAAIRVVGYPDSDQWSDSRWQQLEVDLHTWWQAAPKSTLPPLRLARHQLNRAWHLRGTGWAKDVPAERWPEIHSLTRQARDLLQKMPASGHNDPEWYVTMLDTLLLDRDDKLFATTLADGMRRFPEYHEMYFSAAVGLQPKWGGSLEAIHDLAQQAVKRTKGHEGQAMYARIYWYLAPQLIRDSNADEDWRRQDWSNLKPGFDSLLQRYPSSWNRTVYVAFACNAHDYKTLEQQLTLLGTELDTRAWSTAGDLKPPSYCQDLLAAYVQKGRKPLTLDEEAQFDSMQFIEAVKRRAQAKKTAASSRTDTQ